MTLRSLKDATVTWQPAAQKNADPLVALTAAWPSIVGKDIAAHSRPLEINGDTLLVATRSSAWTQQLSFLGDHVLRSIGQTAHLGGIEKIRFRVGKLRATAPSGVSAAGARTPARRDVAQRAPAASIDEVLANFRAGVSAIKRAKTAAGWKECLRCGLPVARGGSGSCLPCEQAQSDTRSRKVARLLFEAPWLGYAGTANIVKALPEREYESIRHRLLSRWWEILSRAARSRALTKSGRERLIASSYVILKSGLDPEEISPAVVRNLLGDELHDLIYGISE
ncbi:MAG: DUF721 domain-containing protein [Candidatus Eremiobacteraeota bacterium]|nr:DUF721 domain-containing protein [Candidatus Eremiobacteraeota bacterium]